jgi:hypothetical protein
LTISKKEKAPESDRPGKFQASELHVTLLLMRKHRNEPQRSLENKVKKEDHGEKCIHDTDILDGPSILVARLYFPRVF